MKILLTGANGFVGRHLVRGLLKHHKIRCLVRNNLGIDHRGLEVMYGDVVNAEDISRAVAGMDVVIHAAAVLHDADSLTYRVNVGGTRALVEAAKKQKVRKFIFLSTENVVYEYCQDAYTASKREAEKYAKGFPNHVILRPSLVYGKGDARYIMYLASLIKKYPLIPIFGNGKNTIQPVYVEDLVKFVMKSLSSSVKGTYLVCGKNAISYNDIVEQIQKMLGVQRFILHLPLALMKPCVSIYEKIFQSPKIRSYSLEYLRYDRAYETAVMEKVFHHTPHTFAEGMRAALQ